ncbi:MAG: hypothetical protein ACRDRL_20250 [Sciscionella sp.]
MVDGFGTVPDDLRAAAATIGTTAARTAGITWREPTGDYGHAGLQSSYVGFIGEMKRHIATLTSTVEGHGDNLRDAAASYLDSDANSSTTLGNLAAGIGGSVVGGMGGSDAAGMGTAEGVAAAAAAGADSIITQRLNPGGGRSSGSSSDPDGASG